MKKVTWYGRIYDYYLVSVETGLARQFRYEKSQSRIGGSLWETRDKFIENIFRYKSLKI